MPSDQSAPPEVVTVQAARRLALVCQRLAGERLPASRAGIRQLVHELGCVQIDPMRVVERSHWLVLWSRLGKFVPDDLEHLLHQKHDLVEYWAHAASIVARQNLPIHRHQMAAFAQSDRLPARRTRRWLETNAELRQAVLDQLAERGPCEANELEAVPHEPWISNGWTNQMGVQHMLLLLWRKGEVAIAGRAGNRKQWAVAGTVYGPTPDKPLPLPEAVAQAAGISLRALGVARLDHIRQYFIRGFYPDLEDHCRKFVAAGERLPLKLVDERGQWPGEWFAHADNVGLLRKLKTEAPECPPALLSPFDNLIADRERTKQLWDFEYTSELYVPKAKRVYGHYVMPFLFEGQLVGRMDVQTDRDRKVLHLIAAHAQDSDRRRAAVGVGLAQALASLAEFVGAESVKVSRRVPSAWRPPLVAGL